MTKEQVELINKIEAAISDIVKDAITGDDMDVANVVYCSNYASEELALKYTRELKRKRVLSQGEVDVMVHGEEIKMPKLTDQELDELLSTVNPNELHD